MDVFRTVAQVLVPDSKDFLQIYELFKDTKYSISNQIFYRNYCKYYKFAKI